VSTAFCTVRHGFVLEQGLLSLPLPETNVYKLRLNRRTGGEDAALANKNMKTQRKFILNMSDSTTSPT